MDTAQFDVTFRSRELGLGLTTTTLESGEEIIAVVSVTGAARTGGVQEGDQLTGLNGTNVEHRGLDDVLGMLRNTTRRPLRLTFVAGKATSRNHRLLALPPPAPALPPPRHLRQNTRGLGLVELDCAISFEEVLTPRSGGTRPNDATLVLTMSRNDAGGDSVVGKVQLRGALTTDRKRAVIAVRSASGGASAKGVHPGDTLVAIDGKLVVPPPDARGVHYLMDKCVRAVAEKPSVRVVFARTDTNEDVLYTIALSAEEEEEDDDDDDDDSSKRRSGSWMIKNSIARKPPCATETWGLELTQRSGVLVVNAITSKTTAARVEDVLVLMDNHHVSHYTLLAFGVAADAAARKAKTSKRGVVALTLVSPDLFNAHSRLFVTSTKPPAAAAPAGGAALPPPSSSSSGGPEEKVHDSPDSRRDLVLLSSSSLNQLRPSERRKLAQLNRLLSQGVGAEQHALREDTGMPAKPKPVVISGVGDLAGIDVIPAYGLGEMRIYFDDMEGVDMPMPSKYAVGSATLASSLSVAYRRGAGGRRLTLDLSTDCPALAHSLAEGLLIAITHQCVTRSALVTAMSGVDDRAARRAAPPATSSSGGGGRRAGHVNLAIPGSSSLLASLSSDGQGRVRSRRLRTAASALMFRRDTKRAWWQTLNSGVVVEVMYAADTYTVRTPLGEVMLTGRKKNGATRDNNVDSGGLAKRGVFQSLMSGGNSPPNGDDDDDDDEDTPFKPGQYCRAKVKRAMRLRREHGTGYATRYLLQYLDGPHDYDWPATTSKRKFPKGTLFVSVPRDVIVVKYANQQQYWPLALVLLSGLQIASFVFYSKRKPGGWGRVKAGSPVVGPKWLHYQLISNFPQCKDRRPQVWRLWTYQFAHIGYTHIVSNIFVQLVFGIPVEIVHGHLISFLVYQLGVALGSLTCAFSDIHKTVVGASGGVYTLIGLHTADCCINWRAMAEDISLLIRGSLCVLVPLFDVMVYVFIYKDADTSYSAHVGGWIGGFLFGLCFLRPVAESIAHRFLVRPLALFVLVLFVVFSVAWFQLTYPPKYFLNGPFWALSSYNNNDHSGSCCWQLLDCKDVHRSEFDRFSCDEGATIYPKRYRTADGLEELDTCAKIRDWLEEFPNDDLI
ncbi:hypothetical protein CTAYLR_005975 [Chrysophaeum taylorii]|uniref:PDZ domain-containing protein n=1 Tax=Chrysophaeum taylorii TaxID=2483200 RepID=A0AAD7UK96_9STRA|nr:hypothetical protein CTAYLR_005975 [Chrysophaeum taylorii]